MSKKAIDKCARHNNQESALGTINPTSLRWDKKSKTTGPIKKPNINCNVTLGTGGWRPSKSVLRPRSSKLPRVMCVFARSSIASDEKRAATMSEFRNELMQAWRRNTFEGLQAGGVGAGPICQVSMLCIGLAIDVNGPY
jgi:hypothetical protein